MSAAATLSDTAPAEFTEDRRSRLVGACLGAHASELVTVRAGDLRAMLARAENIDQALEILGDNVRLADELAVARGASAQIPVLRDRITALEFDKAALASRMTVAAQMLLGKAP